MTPRPREPVPVAGPATVSVRPADPADPAAIREVAIAARIGRSASGTLGAGLAADVLVADQLAEPFYAARGFEPGEPWTDESAGEEIVERRWWPRTAGDRR